MEIWRWREYYYTDESKDVRRKGDGVLDIVAKDVGQRLSIRGGSATQWL